jgi:hypothetical protein
MPLDWMLHSLHRWFTAAMAPFGVDPAVRRVDGAWCPGFSDIAVRDRKIAGLGFRVTRDTVVMRGLMAVLPMSDDDFRVLARCHQLIGLDLRRDAAISLAEASPRPVPGVAATISAMRDTITT